MECDSITEIQMDGTWNAIQLEGFRGKKMECDSIREIQVDGTWNAIQLERFRWTGHGMLFN
jgi:hypothetical protein